MRSATELMVRYAAFHRDRRNIATHFVAIPLIVFAVAVLLARPAVAVAGLVLTPAILLWALSTLWYLTRGNLALGLAVSLLNGVLVAMAQPLALGGTAGWLGWGLGILLLGGLLQFVGHYYEGRRSHFAGDLASLLVGPMFITAEWLFSLGWGKPLLDHIERAVGPTHLRDLHAPIAR